MLRIVFNGAVLLRSEQIVARLEIFSRCYASEVYTSRHNLSFERDSTNGSHEMNYVIEQNHVEKLRNNLAQWKRFLPEEREIILSESLTIFAEKIVRGEHISKIDNWLLGVAKKVSQALL